MALYQSIAFAIAGVILLIAFVILLIQIKVKSIRADAYAKGYLDGFTHNVAGIDVYGLLKEV